MVAPFLYKEEGNKISTSNTEGHLVEPIHIKMSLMDQRRNIQVTFPYCTYYLMIVINWILKTVVRTRQGKDHLMKLLEVSNLPQGFVDAHMINKSS